MPDTDKTLPPGSPEDENNPADQKAVPEGRHADDKDLRKESVMDDGSIHLGYDDVDQYPESLAVGYEKRDVNLNPFFVAMLVVVIIIVVVMAAVWPLSGFLRKMAARADVPASPIAGQARELPPAPNLQVAPRAAMDRFLLQENAHLASYGVNPQTNKYYMPIEKAMDKALAAGFPVRADGATSESLEAHTMIPSRSSSGRTMERRDK
ncbi:hypothetical protein CVU37_09680 [candidate division BRC1 bacterium HGW-BRC1-1]|jgi:hypothetical protein|nr:MAG: hypothetical protein CVU37_09680 [candidate division BRC1 bacterium HGW-BRC1-1]